MSTVDKPEPFKIMVKKTLSSTPLFVPKLFPFNNYTNISQSALIKNFRISPKSAKLISSLIEDNTANQESKKMLGGFYKLSTVKEYGEKDIKQELELLSQQTGLKIRPGSTLEFLQFFRDRNFKPNEIPEISLILGNLVFSLFFLRHFFELVVYQKNEELDHHVQVFCVQE